MTVRSKRSFFSEEQLEELRLRLPELSPAQKKRNLAGAKRFEKAFLQPYPGVYGAMSPRFRSAGGVGVKP